MFRSLTFFLLIILLVSCERPKSVNEKVITDEHHEIANKMDRYLRSVATMGFSGSIIVAKGDAIILESGYGLANRANRTDYTATTIQTCGSVTKQFTGAAILLLESQKKISLTDPLSKYFQEAPESYKNISIHQLLTHSGGLIGGIGPDEERISKSEFLARLWSEPLEFEPGTGYHYSNAGYSLLGMIIEQLTEMSYEDYLIENLFIPSGMNNTGYLSVSKDSSNVALGYLKGDYWGKVIGNGWLEDGPNWHLRANGGIHTTAKDMYQWYQVMRGKGVLSQEIIEKWTTGYVYENNDDSKYAYGLVEYEDPQFGKVISHNGSNRIYSADLFWFPEKDLFLYIQANSSLFPAYEVSNQVLSAAFDSNFVSMPDLKAGTGIDPDQIKKLQGNYEIEGGSVELTSDDIRLTAKLRGQAILDLFLDHSEEQQDLFSTMNQKTLTALDKLSNGEKDALKILMPEGADAEKATSRLQRQIDRIGNLESLNLIGTFENVEHSRFAEIGSYTTFVHARFKNWNRYWNLVFDKNGNYLGTYGGPWPSFTLIPESQTKFSAINQDAPYGSTPVIFKDDCLILNDASICQPN